MSSTPGDFAKNLAIVTVTYIIGIFWALLASFRIIKGHLTGTTPDVPKRSRSKPAILNDPALGKHDFLQLQSGVKIHYVAAGEKGKPLMLFVHGFPDFWFSWRHQIKHFKTDYRVVAFDNRGYGDSDKPKNTHAYSIPLLVEDVRCIIEALGYKSCVLVGHDWGGIISWSFATTHPEMVDRLIILNCPHLKAVTKMTTEQKLKQFLKSWYIFLFQLPWLPEYIWTVADMFRLEGAYTKPPMGAAAGTISAEEVEALKYTFGQPGAFTPPINYYRNLFRLFPPKMPVWAPLPMPVLIIWGTSDAALSVEAAEASREFVQGNFELERLEGISHWVQHEAPDRVNEAIREFLKKQQ